MSIVHYQLSICLLLLFSLTPLYSAKKPRPLPLPLQEHRLLEELGYTGERLVTFYYTEGLKASLLYKDQALSMRLFAKAIEADSTHAPSYYERASILLTSAPEKALEYSRKAVRLDSTNFWYRNQLGRLLLITENYDGALAVYERLVREAPHYPENYRLLAALYEEKKLPFTAIAILDSAEYRLGRIEELASYKRELLINVKLFDKAIEESKALVRDFPFREENYLVLAQLYAAAGKDSLAQANFNEALALNPTNVETLGALVDFYKEKGDYAKMLSTARIVFQSDDFPLENKIAFIEDVMRDHAFYQNFLFQISDLTSTLLIKYPDHYGVFKLYTRHLFAVGTPEEALKLYKGRLPAEGRKNIDILNTILDVEAHLKRPDSVAKYVTMAIEYFPRNTDLHIRYGSILSYLEENKKARQAYEKALKYATTDFQKSAVYGILGDLAHRDGKTRKSYSYYDRALKYNPDNAMVLNNYSYFLSTSDRQLERACEMGRRATELQPNFSTYIDTYAWALYKLGRYDEAKKVMQQALSLDRSGSTELMLHYGDILYALKDYFMASVYWKKALENGHDAEEVNERLQWINPQ